MTRLRNRADINYFFDIMRVKYLNKLINGMSGVADGINGGFLDGYIFCIFIFHKFTHRLWASETHLQFLRKRRDSNSRAGEGRRFSKPLI